MAHTLRVLGPPEIVDGDGNPVSLSLGKPLALLVYVACQNSPVSRDELADLLWPEAERHRSRHSVRQALWVIRNALGEEVFENHDPLSLREGGLVVDLRAFSEALSSGEVEEARALWRGPVLDHFGLAGARHWNHWIEDLRGDLEYRFCRALLQHAQVLAKDGNADAAVSALDQAVQISPQAETPHLARISHLLDLGRLDGAREALADSHRMIGDQPELSSQLAVVEERLEQIVLEQRSRVAEGESFPMEFVGRSRELAGLHAIWREAEKGRTKVGLITGPSGIGKTRLAHELTSYVSKDEIRPVSVRGVRAEMRLRWGAVSDFVRQLLRLPGSAGISSASDSLLRAMLPSLGRDEISLQTVNGVSPAAILDAIADLLESVSYEAPLVALVDDFQWLDQESRSLFVGLANRCREFRVLFLFLGRADLSSRHWEEVESALMSEAGATRFLLNSLIEEEIGELLALGAAFPDPGEAAAVVRKIFEASSGNPLFIREILKELHEQGILQREESGWVFQTSKVPEEFELPENIRHLLRERLDRLSEPAASLAAILATENRGCSTETLQRETQLPPAVFTQAVAELLDRGVIEWVDGNRLEFMHDLLRDTASVHLAGSLPEKVPQKGWLSRGRFVRTMGVTIIAALVMGALWGQGMLPWGSQPAPLPYGGGVVVFRNGEVPFRPLKVTEGGGENWEPAQLDPSPPPGARWVFRGPGESLAYLGVDDTGDGPDVVEVLPDGVRIPFFTGPGDHGFLDASPEGGRVLLQSENVGKEPFSHSIYWMEYGLTRTPHLIFEGSGPLGLGRWSPDGDLVAFNMGGASDSLAVYSLTGARIWTHPFDEIRDLDWCPGGIVASVLSGGQPQLFHIVPLEDEVTLISNLDLSPSVTCSPDGSALIHLDILDGHATYVIRDLNTREVIPFPEWDHSYPDVTWLTDQTMDVPISVRAELDTIRIDWGDKLPLTATMQRSNHVTSPDGIRWEAVEPEVANFDSEEKLTGNRVGSTTVLARWGYSLVDTVVVIVEEGDSISATPVFREPWDSLDSTRWVTFGSHPPEIVRIEGENALEIKGDEKYSDGLISTWPLDLEQGITVEFEFKMDISRDVHQRFSVRLWDFNPANLGRGQGRVPGGGQVVRVSYPSRDLEKIDRSDLSLFVSPGVETRVRLPDDLPTSGWTHLAIQIRADGESSLVINRERVATSPVLLPTTPQHQWNIYLEGDAVGTRLFIRNLNVWPEVRY